MLTGMKRTTPRESKRLGAFSSEVDSGSREENASKQKTSAPYQGFPIGSVIRRIARASFGASQRMSLVSDIASTMEEATPILVM